MPKTNPKRLKRLNFWRVMFHNGMRHIGPFVVVAHSKSQARTLAEPCAPEALYGPNVVFLKAEKSLDFPITINEEIFKLIAEKTGIYL